MLNKINTSEQLIKQIEEHMCSIVLSDCCGELEETATIINGTMTILTDERVANDKYVTNTWIISIKDSKVTDCFKCK